MADFVAVLKKTLDGLGQTTPATRAKVYDKARNAIAAKLAAMNPPPPAAVVDRQTKALEDAIASVEAEYGKPSDPLAELESVFASLKNPQPKSLGSQPPQPAAPPVAAPAPAPTPRIEASRPRTTPLPPQPAAAQPPAIQPEEPQPPELQFAAKDPVPLDDPDLDSTVSAEPPSEGEDERVPFGLQRQKPRRRSYGGLVAAGLVLAVLAGGGYGVWLNRDAFSDLLGSGGPQQTAQTPAPAETPAPAAGQHEPAEETPAEAAETPSQPTTEKFTQRLTPEGTEVDPGPAGGETGLGEGTSVAALTQPPLAPSVPGVDIAPAEPGTPPADGDQAAADGAAPDAPAAPDAAQADTTTPAGTEAAPAATVPVGQKAIFYEERTAGSEGSAEPGSIVWSLIQESPGANQPPEPAIRAEATIPGKDLQLRMTIKRNADQSLPASHIIEMIFLTPDGFEGGGIDNILRIAMKGSEQEAGNPLIGIPAKIADGFFLVALNDSRAEMNANMTLMRRQSWIDVPIVYKSGRRALFTMEKGIPGEKVFDEALKAWQTASAG